MSAPSRIPTERAWSWGPFSGIARPRTIMVALAFGLATTALWLTALSWGTYQISPQQVLNTLFWGSPDPTVQSIVFKVRLPRAVGAVAVGMALGASGAVFQSLSKNPLGSPDIIGFTTGAATGAIIQIVFLDLGSGWTALFAVVSGLTTAILVYLLSRSRSVSGSYRMVLVGIGCGAVLTALNTLLLAHGQIELALQARAWLAGSLDARTWSDVWPVTVATLGCLPLLVGLARRLDVLAMGEDLSRALGIQTERLRFVTMLAAVVLAATAVAATGPIGFVALIAPQLVRQLAHSFKVSIVASALAGAALLLGADLLAQHLPVRVVLPVGLVTGLLGGIYLLWLLTRAKKI